MKRSAFTKCWVVYSTLLFHIGVGIASEPSFVFARAPQLSAMTQAETWGPLLARIKKDTGINMNLKVYQTRIQFQAEISAAVPDFGFMSAYDTVRAKQLHGYTPFIRDSKPLKGVIVVPQNSALKSLQDLHGKTIVFPHPQSFGASLYLQNVLIREENIRYSAEYAGSHENVYRGVFLGKYAVGGGVLGTLDLEPEELRAQLRILYQTPNLPSHAFTAHPRVSKEVISLFTAALVNLSTDEEGRALLKAANIESLVEADYAKDYQLLEGLRLDEVLTPDITLKK